MKRLISGLGVFSLAIGALAAPTRAQSSPDDLNQSPVIAFLENFRLIAPPGTELPPDLVGDQVAGGQSWAIDDEVELYLNGTFVSTSIAEQNAEGSASPFFDLGALGVRIQSGDEVKLALADGSRVETHLVRDIDVTDIDVSTDTVTGTAEQGSEVWVVALFDEGGSSATADAQGNWVADLSMPGGAAFDLVGGAVIFVFQFDADGNATARLRAAETPLVGKKIPVQILGQSELSPVGVFDVEGPAAPLLCLTGTVESDNTLIEWIDDVTFKIWQDKILTCETGEVLVLELKNTIVIGEGGVPGKGTWKLRNSTGFDPAPKGKGDIIVVSSSTGEPREAYVGLLKFK